jgi:hypothetical protein
MTKALLPKAVTRLVQAATTDANDRELRRAVNDVVQAFAGSDTRATRDAIATIAEGMHDADGRSAQVLLLTLGALVEAGAPPELAWPVVADDLPRLLEGAARFAAACVERASGALEEALPGVAAEVASRRPRDAAAWQEVPARCLAAIACLTRSRDLRESVKRQSKLLAKALPLADAIDEAGMLVEVLRILNDEAMRVVHEDTRKGFRVAIRDIASNAELLLFLGAALGSQFTSARSRGRAPDPRVVAAVKAGKPKKVTLSLDFRSQPLEAAPADFPTLDGERVVVLRELPSPRALEFELSYPALEPSVRIDGPLTTQEVDACLLKTSPKKRSATGKRRPSRTRPAR